MNTIYDIDEEQDMLDKAVHISRAEITRVSKKLDGLAKAVVDRRAPIGYVAKYVAMEFTEEECLLATCMFIASAVNGDNPNRQDRCKDAIKQIKVIKETLKLLKEMKSHFEGYEHKAKGNEDDKK